jgi:hypothetical protein
LKKLHTILIFLIFLLFINIHCKKAYSPPAVRVNYNYLVVNGTLINSTDSPTVIQLSTTKVLSDSTFVSAPETGANVTVQGTDNEVFQLPEIQPGMYQSLPLHLGYTNQYRLNITVSNGSRYQSDYIPVKQTPPIDSITWQQKNDVMIYVNTHDPANNTKYYRWDYVETYQYEAPLNAELGTSNGRLYYVDSTDQTYDCWLTVNSKDILAGSSVALAQDVINQAPITTVPKNSQKISIRYSILVKQYAITQQAYQYLEVLKTNTENLGSIFDAQPTQLTGNFHSVQNPSEPVIGFLTASSVQQERLFITKYDVTNWHFVDTNRECEVTSIGHAGLPDPAFFVYDYPDPDFYPYYLCGTTCLNIARRQCVDCRLRGGVNQKPSFW